MIDKLNFLLSNVLCTFSSFRYVIVYNDLINWNCLYNCSLKDSLDETVGSVPGGGAIVVHRKGLFSPGS